ncbi:MAG: hypothetical protein HOQ18_18420, partial [Dermatophilaceae bacterium]|nr:hypothetical protein [Dermatophilaceae bacterium]
MTDESTTPDREPTPAPQAPEPAAPAAHAPSAPEDARSTGGPAQDREPTGIIDLHDTRAIPSESPAQPGPSAPAGPRRDDGGDDAWFDVFGGEHPVD